jgi:hypothetical protein
LTRLSVEQLEALRRMSDLRVLLPALDVEPQPRNPDLKPDKERLT